MGRQVWLLSPARLEATVSPTLTTAPDGRATMLCHPGKLRPLTVGESPGYNNFLPIGNSQLNSQKYIQIGNAVPTGLGLAIGKALLETARLTLKHGLPADLKKLRGKLVCADSNLAARIKNRPKTQLNPPRLRKKSRRGSCTCVAAKEGCLNNIAKLCQRPSR